MRFKNYFKDIFSLHLIKFVSIKTNANSRIKLVLNVIYLGVHNALYKDVRTTIGAQFTIIGAFFSI